jgi:hypothetical protein
VQDLQEGRPSDYAHAWGFDLERTLGSMLGGERDARKAVLEAILGGATLSFDGHGFVSLERVRLGPSATERTVYGKHTVTSAGPRVVLDFLKGDPGTFALTFRRGFAQGALWLHLEQDQGLEELANAVRGILVAFTRRR